MQIAPPVRVQTRVVAAAPRWELFIRYGAAYICTLVAVATAQLRIPTDFALLLAVVTVAGLPVSLYLRATRLRVGSWRLQRPLVNSFIVTVASLTSLYRFRDIIPLLPRPNGPSITQFLLGYNTEFPFEVLMQVFLLFAVWRCMTIITDNDAVLCALASFPVLLLMIVIHKGYEVVGYFLVWALASAVLFALDHRVEARHGVVGRLPSVVPGQDVKLSARSLATVLAISLVCAVILSYTLTSRESDERTKAETWLALLAARMTKLALDMPDGSVNSGPERQIDFTSSPSLPSHKPLWYVQAATAEPRSRIVRPMYWRMFTLGKYDGATWSQLVRSRSEEVFQSTLPVARDRQSRSSADWPIASNYMRFPRDGTTAIPGFNIARHNHIASQFGAPRRLLRQRVVARVFNYGFVPVLPALRQLRIVYGSTEVSSTNRINARRDSSAEVGVLDPGGIIYGLSEVPPGMEYGGASGHPPHLRSQRPNPGARLTPLELATYTTLPATLPRGCRLRQLAQQLVGKADPQESDFLRAKRLELFIMNNGTYTLHPPAIPTGQDAADYFIFKSRRGYCTYFAGALTVLCRAAGIPARVVTGFVNPESSPDSEMSIIHESNAHAWTEVWVPNWGWATLDATPADDRGNNAPRWWDAWTEAASLYASAVWGWVRVHALLTVLCMLCLANLILGFMAWRLGFTSDPRLRRYLMLPRLRWLAARTGQINDDTTRQMVLQAYQQAARDLSRRFRQRAPWETSVEWLQAAEATLDLRDPEPLRRLTTLYALARYSPAHLDAATATAAYQALTDLSWQRSR